MKKTTKTKRTTFVIRRKGTKSFVDENCKRVLDLRYESTTRIGFAAEFKTETSAKRFVKRLHKEKQLPKKTTPEDFEILSYTVVKITTLTEI